MATVFDILKRITVAKTKWDKIPEEERAAFNKWMVNRFLSMDQNYVELVNIVQKNTWQMSPEHIYRVYSDIIPEKQVWLKYIKPTKKKEYKPEEIAIISEYFQVSKRDAREYIEMLPKDELKAILLPYNLKQNKNAE